MNNLLKASQQFLKKNSATILTVAGAVGVVGTAVVTANVTTKVSSLLKEAEEFKGDELTFDEKLRLAAPLYIPAVLTGVATITCIFGANHLNRKYQASLIGAYTMLDQSYKNYKGKVKELYGKEGHEHVVDEIVRADISKAPKVYAPEKELFYDLYSGRYFENTMENVLKAENEINKQMHSETAAGINDLYIMLGMDPISDLDNVGWKCGLMESSYWASWIDFDYRKTTLDDGLECIILDFPHEPFINYLD